MKIKHFAGYGCVNATKISSTTQTTLFGEKIKVLKIKVSGVHEYGLDRDDKYDLYYWLVKRFDKSVKDYRDILDYHFNDYMTDEIDKRYEERIENCDYTFTIAVRK